MHGPVELRYKWRKGEKLIYRYVSGKIGAKTSDRDGFRQDIALTVASVEDGGTAVVDVESEGGGQWIAGTWLQWEPETMRRVCRVDSRGRVLKILKSEGGSTGERVETFGRGPWTDLSEGVIGLPIGDLAVGVLRSCLLPPGPVAVGDSWTGEVNLEEWPGQVSPVAFEGRLLRLQQSDADSHAVIECRLLPSSVARPYVSEARFDVERGRMVSVNWKTLLGAPRGWIRRQDLLESGAKAAERARSRLNDFALLIASLAVSLVFFFWLPLRIARRQWLRKRELGSRCSGNEGPGAERPEDGGVAE
jgi:hypothetical protein